MRMVLALMVLWLCGAAAQTAHAATCDLLIELGPWHCIGPFKDAAFGIARTSFDTRFAPEQDALRAGAGPIDLGKNSRKAVAR